MAQPTNDQNDTDQNDKDQNNNDQNDNDQNNNDPSNNDQNNNDQNVPQNADNNDNKDNDDNNADPVPRKQTPEEILSVREEWELIKKSLDAVMPLVDQVIRIEKAGNKPNKLKKMKKKKKKQLKDFKTKLSKLQKDDPHVLSGMELFKKLSKDLTADELGNLNFDIRRFTQSIVKIRRELMDQYKKAKKDAQ